MNYLKVRYMPSYPVLRCADIFRGFLLLSLFLLASCGGGGSSTEGSSTAVSLDNSAILTWQSPDVNSDGTPISDLAGHVIYMSNTSGVYDMNDIVSNVPSSNTTGGSPETYTVSDLGPGTYYFQIAAYNSAGFESAPSIEVQKTIQ